MSTFTLADLDAIIAERASAADTSASYTAKLLADGPARCAKKFGEEAVETVLAAVNEDDAALAGEAGDVIYHLLVLLRARGIPLADVMAVLEGRTRQSGLAEKASRATKS